jgi:hypothetical protein
MINCKANSSPPLEGLGVLPSQNSLQKKISNIYLLFLHTFFIPLLSLRDVAQPGSALAWGARGRWFESSRPDILSNDWFEHILKKNI